MQVGGKVLVKQTQRVLPPRSKECEAIWNLYHWRVGPVLSLKGDRSHDDDDGDEHGKSRGHPRDAGGGTGTTGTPPQEGKIMPKMRACGVGGWERGLVPPTGRGPLWPQTGEKARLEFRFHR